MLTRQLPFTAETPLAVAVMHCSSPPPTPSQLALVHPALESVCLRALCKAKEARYQSARDMQLALQDAVAATNAQLALKPRKRRPYPLAVPPISVPPVARQQSPASLAPFELHSEPEPSQPAKSGTKNAAFALLFVVATAGLTAITLFGAGQHESGSGTPKSTYVTAMPAEARRDARDDQMAPRDVRDVNAAPVPMPSAPEVESASSAFARVEQAASAAATAATSVAPSQPLEAAARPVRAEREARDTPDTADTPDTKDKQARRAAPLPGPSHRPQQPMAAEDFDTGDEPRLSVKPVAAPSGDMGRKAPGSESAAKQAVVTASVEPPVEVMKTVEPEIPVGLVELPSRGKVVVTPDPAKPAVIPASTSPDHAQVRYGSIVTQSAVSKASIRGALNDAAIRRCYQDALRLGAAGGSPMTAQLELATGMSGRVSSANVTGGLPKQLATCVEQVAKSGRVREVDTGVAKATITLEFQP
jgi:hypothetical protein